MTMTARHCRLLVFLSSTRVSKTIVFMHISNVGSLVGTIVRLCVKYGTGFKRRRSLARTMPGGAYRQAKLVFGITRQPSTSGGPGKKQNDPLELENPMVASDSQNLGQKPENGHTMVTASEPI